MASVLICLPVVRVKVNEERRRRRPPRISRGRMIAVKISKSPPDASDDQIGRAHV